MVAISGTGRVILVIAFAVVFHAGYLLGSYLQPVRVAQAASPPAAHHDRLTVTVVVDALLPGGATLHNPQFDSRKHSTANTTTITVSEPA